MKESELNHVFGNLIDSIEFSGENPSKGSSGFIHTKNPENAQKILDLANKKTEKSSIEQLKSKDNTPIFEGVYHIPER